MHWWLYKKFIFQKHFFKEPTTLFSLLGITLGVAFLVVSMAGFSGFTNSLKFSIIDVSGDINILKRGSLIRNPDEIIEKLHQASDHIVSVAPYAQIEPLVAGNGQLGAVFLRGIDWGAAKKQNSLVRRVIAQVKSGEEGLGAPAYVGKVIAENLKLKVGDSFKAILLKASKSSASQVSRSTHTFYVHALVDLGKYEFNERVMMTDLKTVQEIANMGAGVNGLRVTLTDSDLAAGEVERLQEVLGWDFFIRDWSSINRSLFKAIQYEKMVLFFVMLIMVIAAFFNVSSTLFLSVVRRYPQVSVLRALGMKQRDVVVLFCLNGLALGGIGLGAGLLLGGLFCYSFEQLQKIYPIMPEDVYKMSNFSTQFQIDDTLWVVAATLVICFFSTLAPAFKGASLPPVEGLKYE